MSYILGTLPVPKIQFFDDNGTPLVGGLLYTCNAGSSITELKASFQDSTGSIPNTNPIILDSAGRTPAVFLEGFYHIFLQDSLGVAVYDVDNISAQSFTTAITVEWQQYQLSPTFVNGTQFTVPGNVTSNFPIGRRIYAVLAGNNIYGTISNVAAGGDPIITTITVIWDSGSLDATVSVVFMGILSSTNLSSPILQVLTKAGSYDFTAADMNRRVVGTGGSSKNFSLPGSVPSGSWLRIHNADTGTITLVGTVNGVASPTIKTQGDVALFFDGSSWYGLFYDPVNGTFTATLGVGSSGGFPAFAVDNVGQLTVTGGPTVTAVGTITFTGIPTLGSWNVFGQTGTFVSETNFTISNDQTSLLIVGLRFKATVTAGTVYGTIASAVYSGLASRTTVVLVMDSGVLDSGLGTFYTGTGETFVIDEQTFVWVQNRVQAGQVTIGGTAAACCTNLITAITTDLSSVIATQGAGTTVVITATVAGIAGNDIIFTTASTNMTMNGSGKLGGTIAGMGGVWQVKFGATPVFEVLKSNALKILTRGFVSAAPTANLEIASKKYVDDTVSALQTVVFGSPPIPGAPPVVPPPLALIGAIPLVAHPFTSGIAGFSSNTWHETGIPAFSGHYTLGSATGTNPGGYFHNIYVGTACNAYFHFFATGAFLEPPNTGLQYGWRVAAGPVINQSPGPDSGGFFPVGHQPTPSGSYITTDFLFVNTITGYNVFDNVVVGPLALTPGWWAIFIQLKAASFSDYISTFYILGGLYMNLSTN